MMRAQDADSRYPPSPDDGGPGYCRNPAATSVDAELGYVSVPTRPAATTLPVSEGMVEEEPCAQDTAVQEDRENEREEGERAP